MRFQGMLERCKACEPPLFCAACTEAYGQAFAKSARAAGVKEGRMEALLDAASLLDELGETSAANTVDALAKKGA